MSKLVLEGVFESRHPDQSQGHLFLEDPIPAHFPPPRQCLTGSSSGFPRLVLWSVRIHRDEGSTGRADYDAVPDDRLDAFADYVQQDFEQAPRTVTIGLTTDLLISFC